MVKSISDWLAEGESLYEHAVGEYKQLEAEILELEEKMATKLAEVNKLAAVIQKPTLEARAKMNVTVVDRAPSTNGTNERSSSSPSSSRSSSVKAGPGVVEVQSPTAFPASPRTIAQVLQGKGIDRP